MSYINEPIKIFTDDLSARLPAPGGGAAAALAGAVASSLNCMVANFTIGNEKYKEVEKDCTSLLKESERLRDELMGLIQADIDAYTLVSKAYKLPKENEADKEKRNKAIEEATKKAAEVPCKIMNMCYKIILTCKPLLVKGNKNLLSDVGVAACLALGSMKSAFLNVKVNLSCLKDEAYKNDLLKDLNFILSESELIEKEVFKECNKKFT